MKEIERKNESSVVVIRFIGTSNSSSDIDSLSQSIEKQLEEIFRIDEDDEYKKKYNFNGKLSFISERYFKTGQQLIILLDSIDQLSKEDYKLTWLFTKLPKNIKLVFSVLSNYENILDNLKKEIQQENIHELKPLNSKEAKDILSSYLKSANRKISNAQNISIDKMIDRLADINPLQIKLIFDIISKWPSF